MLNAEESKLKNDIEKLIGKLEKKISEFEYSINDGTYCEYTLQVIMRTKKGIVVTVVDNIGKTFQVFL